MNDKIITMCGSTRFTDDMKKWAWEKTKEGYVMLLPLFAKEVFPEIEEYREELGLQHKKKIDMADIVMIFNKDGYVGQSTIEEIYYAYSIGKSIQFLEIPGTNIPAGVCHCGGSLKDHRGEEHDYIDANCSCYRSNYHGKCSLHGEKNENRMDRAD